MVCQTGAINCRFEGGASGTIGGGVAISCGSNSIESVTHQCRPSSYNGRSRISKGDLMEDAVIISGVRTPIGKFQGGLDGFSAPQLGAIAVREAVKRANVDPAQVDECIMGLVVAAGLGQNPARQAALNGGLPPSVGAMTINKVCGSGLKSVALAAQAIQTGNAEIVVAGGMESMTNAPYLLPQARKGYRLGNSQIIDSVVNDGLWDIYNNYHMGMTGENVADKYKITREQQDEYAVNSHRKAVQAWKECRFKGQIVPVEIPARKKGEASTLFDKDEGPREDTSADVLRNLDRKSTRLNSSHANISYAVFCLKKKKTHAHLLHSSYVRYQYLILNYSDKY